ncbi:MAG: 2-phosphosulfolactate phosphatase [Gemmatimonadaceae bacterium]|nr:2-phosphosulfolactate phosphatase [Gemmatimonadaceae bacterium]MCU0626951.1 2-phosphosulfolactate phosphatase [Gemmatimonadaceae bacterium]
MRLDAYLTPSAFVPTAHAGTVVAVVDVLRASTTIVTALAAGARSVIPFADTDGVLRTARNFARGEVVLAGERHMHAIEGFDRGNSPREFVADGVAGRTVLLTTTNGTRALLAAHDAAAVWVAGFVNVAATLGPLLDAIDRGQSVAVLCAGRDGQFALEDATLAGRLLDAIATACPGLPMNDAAATARLLHERYGDDTARLFADAEHGRALADAGFGDDLRACGAIDAQPLRCRYRDHVILGVPVPAAATH